MRFVQLVVIVVATLCSACGPSQLERQQAKAKDLALSQYQELRTSNSSGEVTEIRVAKIRNTLADAQLDFSAIKVEPAELDGFVERAYVIDARSTLDALRTTHNSEDRAKAIKARFLELAARADKNPSELGTNEKELNQIVARNYLEGAKSQGVVLTPAVYKSAGLPVPTIAKTRTVVKTIHSKPAAKQKPTTPVARKTPVTRRHVRRAPEPPRPGR